MHDAPFSSRPFADGIEFLTVKDNGLQPSLNTPILPEHTFPMIKVGKISLTLWWSQGAELWIVFRLPRS